MDDIMIIPAAGRGSRLASELPKVLFPVLGRPMLDYLLERYAPHVGAFAVVVHPSFRAEVERYCVGRSETIAFAVQEEPTGMLDAILMPLEQVGVRDARRIWITWCDQVAVRVETAAALAAQGGDPALVLPTVRRPEPYIHFARDAVGNIVDVLHRREGDEMPDEGESDIGVFVLSRAAYCELLPEFSRSVATGSLTAERNFLPFIPWLQRRAKIRTVLACDEVESVGVNDRADLRRVESYLRDGR